MTIPRIGRGGSHDLKAAETAIAGLHRLQVALIGGPAPTTAELQDLAAAATGLQQISGPTAELGLAVATRIRVELAKHAAPREAGSTA